MTRASQSWIPIALLAGHLGALAFGLIGLLIMLPNPDLWAHDPRAVRVFDWSMDNAGATHILFGAATMFAFFFRLQAVGGPVYLSQIGYVAAALGLVAGTVFLGERYQLATWAGAAIIMAGVAMTTRAQARQ